MLSDITHMYALVASSIFGALLLLNTRTYLRAAFAITQRFILRHLVFPSLIPRTRYWEPWTRADTLLQACYLTINVFCLVFNAATLEIAGLRAARLSLVNLAPTFAGPHVSFLADILGVSLTTCRRIHRSAGVMSMLLAAFHIIVTMAFERTVPILGLRNIGALIVRSCNPVPQCS